MKPTILAIILAVSLCASAYILADNSKLHLVNKRIAKAEIKIAVLQDRFTRDQHHAQRVIDEVREIVTTAYSHIIPVNKGFIAIKEE